MGHNTRENTKILLNGAWVGGTMTVPGVSGGTMAMVLGIYDRLISSVSRVFKEPKQSIPFLLWFALGGAGGILLFSRGISLLLSSRWEVPARFFFLGAVGGGIPLIFKEAGIKRFGSGDAVFVGIGILSALLIGLIPEGLFTPGAGGVSDILIQALGGVIIAVALVLPGISASQMLYMLGIYESTLKAVGNMDIAALVPLAAGGLLGTFFFCKSVGRAVGKTYPAHLSSYSWLYVCFSAGAVSGNSGRSRGSVQPGGCGSGIYADLWDWENELAIAIPHFL